MPSEWNLNDFPHVLAVTGREATANPTTTNDFIVKVIGMGNATTN